MIQAGNKNQNNSKPVGIVVANISSEDSGMPWHPCLTQVDGNLTAIEASILECALAGCSSIWISCDETMQPVVKKRVGDYVRDPVHVAKSSFTRFPTDNQIDIPIYFYMVHPKDRLKRSGPCWDVINTALTVFYISKKITRWSIPDKYYISFANGLYNFEGIREHRDALRKESNVRFRFGGEDFMKGLNTGFSISGEEIRDIVANMRKQKVYGKSENLTFSDLQDFAPIKKYDSIDLDQYFTCNSWENYVKYIKDKNYFYKFDREYYFNMKSFGVSNE